MLNINRLGNRVKGRYVWGWLLETQKAVELARVTRLCFRLTALEGVGDFSDASSPLLSSGQNFSNHQEQQMALMDGWNSTEPFFPRKQCLSTRNPEPSTPKHQFSKSKKSPSAFSPRSELSSKHLGAVFLVGRGPKTQGICRD